MKRMLVAIAAVALALAACSDDNGSKTDGKVPDSTVQSDAPVVCTVDALLPKNNTVGDFVEDGAPQTADNLTALTALIDGGSEKYTQGGKFVCMALQKYKSATKTHGLELWLFDQTDTAGATAAYANTSNPDDQDLTPTIGDASRGHENAIAGIYQADMRKGQYLARVIADAVAGKDDALALLTALASAIQ